MPGKKRKLSGARQPLRLKLEKSRRFTARNVSSYPLRSASISSTCRVLPTIPQNTSFFRDVSLGRDRPSAAAVAWVRLMNLSVSNSRVLCLMQETSLTTASTEQIPKSRSSVLRLLNRGNKPASFNTRDDVNRESLASYNWHVRGLGICCRDSKAFSFDCHISMLSKFLQFLIIVWKQRISFLTRLLMSRTLRNFRKWQLWTQTWGMRWGTILFE